MCRTAISCNATIQKTETIHFACDAVRVVIQFAFGVEQTNKGKLTMIDNKQAK